MEETLKYIRVLNWGYGGFAPMTLNTDFEKSLQQVQDRLKLLEDLNEDALFVEAKSANGKANLKDFMKVDTDFDHQLHFMRDRQMLLDAAQTMFKPFKDGAYKFKEDGLWTDEQWREYRVSLSMVEKGFEDRLRQFAAAYDYSMNNDNTEPQQEQPEQEPEPKQHRQLGRKKKKMQDLIVPTNKEDIYARLKDKMANASPDVAMTILIHNIKNRIILKPSYGTFCEAFPNVQIPEATYYAKLRKEGLGL